MDALFTFMRSWLKDGVKLADYFIEIHSTGNFILDEAKKLGRELAEPEKYYRTDVEPVRIAPPFAYRDPWKFAEEQLAKLE